MTKNEVESILSQWFTAYDTRIQKQFVLIIDAVNKNTDQLSAMNTKFDTLNNKFDQLNIKYDKQNQEIIKLNSKFDQLNKKYDKQNQEIVKLNNNFEIHNQEIQKLIINNFELQKSVEGIDKKIIALDNKMDTGFKTAAINIQKVLTIRFDQLDIKLDQFQKTFKDFTESDDKHKGN